jgi:hypothetical protein
MNLRLSILFLLSAPLLLAQALSVAEAIGLVTDPSGSAVSGAPTGKDNSLAGTNTITNADRPNLIQPNNVYNPSWGPTLQSINPAAFAQNSPGSFGNLGRDAVRTPGLLELRCFVRSLVLRNGTL